jgi:D-apionolactonase
MPRELTRYELLRGVDLPPAESLALHAGGLALEFEGGDLRYLRAGGVEAVRRIYVSVRDVNWNTVAGEVSRLSIEAGSDSFRIAFDSLHRTSEIDFAWTAEILGSPDGTVTYSMDGRALSSFRYCRIGFCMLHPILGTAGRPYRATTPGGLAEGAFPTLVAPQPVVDGVYLPLFPAFSGLSIALAGGAELTCEYQGELFEIEDQRNWTDGSFKAYCRPSALGFPFGAEVGDRFHQRITVAVSPSAMATRAAPPMASLEVGGVVGRMPSLGFGMSSRTERLGDREVELMRRLRPAHLRVDLHLSDPGWAEELERASDDASAVGTSLEVALFVTDEADQELPALASRVAEARVARYLVFHEREASETSTSPHWVALARRHLATASPGAAFAGGTNGNFAEVNRTRATPTDYDELCYTVNPQVHAFDDRSLVEAIDAQADTVRTARTFFDRPIVVSTVTLKPPFNQAASEEEQPVARDELPPQVDPRQMSRFAAAWTTGSLRALATSGASAATYYETAGWRGLFETSEGSPLPDRFPSLPGMIYPVYSVFASLADAAGAVVLDCRSMEPLLVDGLALMIDGRMRLLVANLTIDIRTVRVTGLSFTRGRLLRVVGPVADANVADMDNAGPHSELAVSHGSTELVLDAFEVVQIDETEDVSMVSPRPRANQGLTTSMPRLRRNPRRSQRG